MVYTAPIFLEGSMTEAQKIAALNTLETQYDEAVIYIDAMTHDSDYYTKTLMDSTFYRTSSHPSGRSDTGHGSGIDAATVDGYSLADILTMALPPGCITFWTQSVGSIPTSHGWQLLDEAKGRFIIAAGGAYEAGTTGGETSITPALAAGFTSTGHALAGSEIPKHTHGYNDYAPYSASRGSSDNSLWSSGPEDGIGTTKSVNTIANTTSTAHTHDGTFAWTGYYDAGNTLRSGALDLYPPYKAYCWVVRV